MNSFQTVCLMHSLEKKDEDSDWRPPRPLDTHQCFHSSPDHVRKLLIHWPLPHDFSYVNAEYAVDLVV